MEIEDKTITVPALRVKQWLPEWDTFSYDADQHQSKPQPHFYIFSLSAAKLRQLSAIYRRDASAIGARRSDLGIQRRHEPERSKEISRYIAEGFPFSTLNDAQRNNDENQTLRKPGWLPTAIVVNILTEGSERNGKTIDAKHTIKVENDNSRPFATLTLPEAIDERVPPIEVIDGQHRLFAFGDGTSSPADFELPVVAFHGLDISWQAYLFWTINIKPKKINASLAYDLYPLLREEKWLQNRDNVYVYRESRAQELTEALWSTPTSPWYRRINMLGGPRSEGGSVTQAAFIRSLTASMVKSWVPKGRQQIGGIFGGTPNPNQGLAWSRAQQAAFLVTAWRLLLESIQNCESDWAQSLRSDTQPVIQGLGEDQKDPAFYGRNSLLATDQGIRGFQHVLNDLTYVHQKKLDLASWKDDMPNTDPLSETVEAMAADLPMKVRSFLTELAQSLAEFDWRSSKAPNLSEEERLKKAALRGSGGYRELRQLLIHHLAEAESTQVSQAAVQVKDLL